MATTIKLDGNARRKIEKIISRPFKNIRQFWGALALMIDQDTQHIFRGQGARKNKPGTWVDYKASTLATRAGTWNIRYGTDKKGLPSDKLKALKSKWGWGHIGEMRKGIRRYGYKSKLLQASGGFRNSFGLIRLGRDRMIYGTQHELAEDIMSKPTRQVLHITPQDEQRYAAQFAKWYSKGLRI